MISRWLLISSQAVWWEWRAHWNRLKIGLWARGYVFKSVACWDNLAVKLEQNALIIQSSAVKVLSSNLFNNEMTQLALKVQTYRWLTNEMTVVTPGRCRCEMIDLICEKVGLEKSTVVQATFTAQQEKIENFLVWAVHHYVGAEQLMFSYQNMSFIQGYEMVCHMYDWL